MAKKKKTDTLSVECVWKSEDVGPFVRPDFVQGLKKRKKDIQVVRIVKNIMTKKIYFLCLLIGYEKCFDKNKNYK